MRKVHTFNVVEEDPNVIKDHEIRLKRIYNTGMIDIQKRDSQGNLKSIVTNTDVLANPEKGLTPVASGDGFDQAYETLLSVATTAGKEVKANDPSIAALSEAVSVVSSYLPTKSHSIQVGPNKINVAGYVNDDGGSSLLLVLSTIDVTLTVSISDTGDGYIFKKFEIV